VISESHIAPHSAGPVSWTAQRLVPAGLLIVTVVYLWNTLPLLTTLPRINVDEPWLIERAYQLIVSGRPSQPMFLLDEGYLLQPGYGLLLAPWLKLFGVGLLQARLLAVLFGLATLWFVYACGKQLFGAPVGIVAAMFLATDSNFLGVSRFARTDGPAVFFAAMSLAWFLKGRTSSRWFLFGSGAAAGVAMLCHLNCYWVVVVLGLWHLQTYGRRFLLPALVSASGFAAGFGPYLILILTRFKDFNAQLNIFASERVPSLSVSVIASPDRSRGGSLSRLVLRVDHRLHTESVAHGFQGVHRSGRRLADRSVDPRIGGRSAATRRGAAGGGGGPHGLHFRGVHSEQGAGLPSTPPGRLFTGVRILCRARYRTCARARAHAARLCGGRRRRLPAAGSRRRRVALRLVVPADAVGAHALRGD
jgi:hypothetical protein